MCTISINKVILSTIKLSLILKIQPMNAINTNPNVVVYDQSIELTFLLFVVISGSVEEIIQFGGNTLINFI